MSSNIKNYLEINLWRKKQHFLELQSLVDDVVDFLELLMFINVSPP